MYYVYVLISLKDGKFYTGSTDDLKRRMNEHSSGKVVSTSKRQISEIDILRSMY
ncbi:MAG: GIY-YIG nuclease family protein [Desulfohalobiaceae bacterium]|nr:GIY-YIG nuclease family protein [Desulfohalobiaceae bacterium]